MNTEVNSVLDQQPTLGRAERKRPAPNLPDRHAIGAEIAREILLTSAPTQARGFRPLAASVLDLAEAISMIGEADLEALL